MWYGLIIFILVFETVVSIVLPVFNITPILDEPEPDYYEMSAWDQFWNTDYIFGTALLELPPEQRDERYQGLPVLSDEIDLDQLEAGVNPIKTFIGLMSFHIVGAEWLGLIFWLCDIILVLCFLALLRGTT